LELEQPGSRHVSRPERWFDNSIVSLRASAYRVRLVGLLWLSRLHNRHELASRDGRLLDDARGRNPQAIRCEVAKPFWRE